MYLYIRENAQFVINQLVLTKHLLYAQLHNRKSHPRNRLGSFLGCLAGELPVPYGAHNFSPLLWALQHLTNADGLDTGDLHPQGPESRFQP